MNLKKKNFTRFVKSKLSTTKNGKLEGKILKGQESFRIKSFIQSNIWVITYLQVKKNLKKVKLLIVFFQINQIKFFYKRSHFCCS